MHLEENDQGFTRGTSMVHHQRGSTYAIEEAEATVPRNLVAFSADLRVEPLVAL